MKSYWQKLKDPRWQRKRLSVLSDRNFKCENCEDGEHTLHVHHPAYIKGREPWEYEDDELRVLCEACHAEAHSRSDILTDALNQAKMNTNLCNTEMLVAGFITALSHDGPFPIKVLDAEFADGVAHYFKRPFSEVFSAINGDGYISCEVIEKWLKEMR